MKRLIVEWVLFVLVTALFSWLLIKADPARATPTQDFASMAFDCVLSGKALIKRSDGRIVCVSKKDVK